MFYIFALREHFLGRRIFGYSHVIDILRHSVGWNAEFLSCFISRNTLNCLLLLQFATDDPKY